MIKSYLLVALRNILRNKIFSVVNILGLAFGICSALLIALWLNDEMSYDHFHGKIDRLYKVLENQQYTDGRQYTFSSTPALLVPFIKDNYPEVEKASRFTWDVSNVFRVGDKSFYEAGKFVDPDFLEMFSFAFLEGNPSAALKDKSSIILTEKMAKKYFGEETALGKVILMNAKDSYTVTGVLKDIPQNSSIQFEYLLPFEVFWDMNKSWLNEWGSNNVRAFILLKEGTNTLDFQAKFADEVKRHNEDSNVKLFIQPFGDSYLFGAFENGVQSGGRIEYVKIFSIVTIFVLVIACINFMNLSTAQAAHRAKEVGLRKVIGAIPGQLFRQFMGESFITVLLSSIIAIFMATLTIPLFNEVTGKSISLNMMDLRILLTFIGIIIFTAFAAGCYPAIFISEFKPVQVLKGQLKSGRRAAMFRKTLVVVQFSLSIILIISTTVVFRQMNFMQVRDIGFVRDNVLYVWTNANVISKFETFRNQLLSQPGIEQVTGASHLPIDVGNSTGSVNWSGKSPEDEILFSNMSVDFEFIESMKMEILEGRAFDRNIAGDTANFIVNQKAAEKFGFQKGVAGQDLEMMSKKGKIVGVVKDFNFGSLHTAVEPLIMQLNPTELNCLLVRVKAGENEAALASVEKVWKEYAPEYPFRYSFLSQDWEDLYKGESQRGKVFNTLAVLSILISCLGLFGLSAFSAERRTKELGIRKALGATVPGLIRLMGKEFASLVFIAVCIGCPLGWLIMNDWLKKYAYHVDVGYITLIIAALICLTISMLTISYHAIKVAMSDPVESLRYE